MPIRAGELRDQVTIKTANPGRTGDAAATTVRTQWCRIEPIGGRALEIATATGDLSTHRLTFRDTPEIETKHLIVDGDGNEYEVDHVRLFRNDRQEVYAHLNLQ